jgi:hypothetical protein
LYFYLSRLQAELEEARIKAQEEIMVEIQVAKVSWSQCFLTIDILYTLDSASNYSAIQKLKP